MIKIKFVLKLSDGHYGEAVGELPGVPRMGDRVFLFMDEEEDETSFVVSDVWWSLESEGDTQSRVMVSLDESPLKRVNK